MDKRVTIIDGVAVEDAVTRSWQRSRHRLAQEGAKLDPDHERALAEEGIGGEMVRVARILRGEIRWAEIKKKKENEQSGRRPVLILSADVFNERSGTVIGVDLTSQAPRAGFPLTLELDSAKLPKVSWVKISQIRTLSTERIGRKIGAVSPEELTQVMEGLNEILGA